MSSPAPKTKAPINRKMGLWIVAVIGGVVVLAALILMAGSNPGAKRRAAIESAQQKAVASLPAGSLQSAEQAIRAHAPEPKSSASAASFNSDDLFNQPIVGKPARAGTSNLPPTSAATLADLDRAFRESQKPKFNSPVSTGNGGLSIGNISSAVENSASDGMYEDYPKESTLPQNGSEAVGMAPTSASSAGAVAAETFPVTKPLSPPSTRIVEQGTIIRAVLNGKVDTRNAGTVTATVTQDVYDTIDQSTLLIPKGTRLRGAYASKVDAGSKRIPIQFHRMQLPDGRAVDLGNSQAVDYSGTTGVEGKYHSNILHALGPSLVVALLGTAVDRMDNKRTNEAGPYGTVVQSPSIAEQLTPQVNSQVMSRYGTAQPYFVIPAGTQFKLVTQNDIVIPAARPASAKFVRNSNPSMPQAGVWEDGSGTP